MIQSDRRGIAIVICSGGLLAVLFLGGLRQGGALEPLELGVYDLFVRMAPKQTEENSQITVLEISEKDIQAMGRWPLTDETIVRILETLLLMRPRVIGLDIYRDIPAPPGREELNRIFLENPQVVGVMTVGENGVRALPAITGTEQAAFGDILVDPGGITRRGLLFLDDGQNVYTSFALTLASLYLAHEGIYIQADPVNPTFVRIGETTIEPLGEDAGGYKDMDARGYQFLLDFQAAGNSFRTYPMSGLLTGEVPAKAIEEKIVLIGVTAESVKDYFFTPLSKSFAVDQQDTGINLQGYITSQILRFGLNNTSPIQAPGEMLKWLWLLFWAVCGSLLGVNTRSARRFFFNAIISLLFLSLVDYAAFLAGWWVPLIPPAGAFILAAGGVTAYVTGREQRERSALMKIFSSHVSKEVALLLWEQRSQFLTDGRIHSQNMTATIVFSDLKGFTNVSEKMSPQELIDWLNIYMEAMASLIMTYGGVIDSYAGDGIKVDFGVPVPRQKATEVEQDAINAVTCALAMENEMVRLNTIWGEKGLPEMGVRVGIYTGPVVGGLLGSSQRMKYTTLGDTVNVASRLESYNKESGQDSLCRVLIGDATLDCLGQRFITEKVGEVKLKGKDQPIIVHQVIGPAAH